MITEMQATVLPDEGLGAQPAPSQATEPGAQAPAKPQEPDKSKVDAPVVQTSSQTETRKPSEFAKLRMQYRKDNELLQAQIRKLEERLTSNPVPSVPAKPKEELTDDKVFEQGLGKSIEAAKEAMRKEYEEKMAELEKRLSQRVPEILEKTEKQKVLESKHEEAVKLAEKSGVPFEKADEFIQANGLTEAYLRKPVETLELVLLKLKPSAPAPANNAPTKQQMQSLAGGNPNGRGNAAPNVQNIVREVKEMNERLAEDNSLREDPKFTERMEQLKEEYSKALSAR